MICTGCDMRHLSQVVEVVYRAGGSLANHLECFLQGRKKTPHTLSHRILHKLDKFMDAMPRHASWYGGPWFSKEDELHHLAWWVGVWCSRVGDPAPTSSLAVARPLNTRHIFVGFKPIISPFLEGGGGLTTGVMTVALLSEASQAEARFVSMSSMLCDLIVIISNFLGKLQR